MLKQSICLCLTFVIMGCTSNKSAEPWQNNRSPGAVSDTVISDFGRNTRKVDSLYCYTPYSASEVIPIVNQAIDANISIRTRGRGHSMNFSSIPHEEEILLITHNLNRGRKINDSVVEIETGAQMTAIDGFLRQFGLRLPVLNDGPAGPSLGGYLSAGGVGPGAKQHGGFWENVLSIYLIDGRGVLREVVSSDPLFPWLFGSMGQLGVYVSAKLKVVPVLEQAESLVSLPDTFRIPDTFGESHFDKMVFWFNLIAPMEDSADAKSKLKLLKGYGSKDFIIDQNYFWEISSNSSMPPLIYPNQQDLVMAGVWGFVMRFSDEEKNHLDTLEYQFQKILSEMPNARRYIQAERVAENFDYSGYFGNDIYSDFRGWKDSLDPQHLFNRGSVFR